MPPGIIRLADNLPPHLDDDRRFLSPDPHGVNELMGHMFLLSDHADCGWKNGIEFTLWDAVVAWRERGEHITIMQDHDDEDVCLDGPYLERLAFLARWTEGWIFHVSHVSRDAPHPSVSASFHGPIYVTTEEWMTLLAANRRSAQW